MMTAFKQGQIWLVNFEPSFGHEYRKVRPGVIVQSNIYLNSNQLVTVLPISSKISKKTKLDILLTRNAQNRLLVDSIVKLQQISSFDKRRFIKLIGHIDDSSLHAIEGNLKRYLNIS